MPPVFKALASTVAWILFIIGCLGLVVPTVGWAIKGDLLAPPATILVFIWSAGIASFILSVCAMKLRKMLE